MGRIKQKRPTDARTNSASGGSDLYFRTATSTGTLTVPTVSSTASVSALQYKRNGLNTSTAASTAVTARGILELGTSSTTAAANFILSQPAAAGEELTLVVKLHGSTFGVTVNASTATTVTFGAVAATTDQIRMILPGTLGSGAQLISQSTSRWLVVNHNGATFSTAAA